MMSEIEALKAQVEALEKLVKLKDQTISHLQSYPRNNWYQPHYPYSPFWTYTNGSQITGSQATGSTTNFQAGANYSTSNQAALTSVGGGSKL